MPSMFSSVLRAATPRPSWMPFVSRSNEKLPDCCRRQTPVKPSTHFNAYDGISYRFVDGSLKRRLSATVGGIRVPVCVAQVKMLRRKLEYTAALSPIEEEATAMCESCLSNTFSRMSKTKCITLTTIMAKTKSKGQLATAVNVSSNDTSSFKAMPSNMVATTA
ncbi:hypothetical protein AC1031_010683 [Aphanomyces cochlioides]|nr:hypothetical protein AC1031_010683 [Aphanomyces cochlioides]